MHKAYVDVYTSDLDPHDAAYSSVFNPHDAAYSIVVNAHDAAYSLVVNPHDAAYSMFAIPHISIKLSLTNCVNKYSESYYYVMMNENYASNTSDVQQGKTELSTKLG